MMLIESVAACGVGVAAGLGIGFLDGLFGVEFAETKIVGEFF